MSRSIPARGCAHGSRTRVFRANGRTSQQWGLASHQRRHAGLSSRRGLTLVELLVVVAIIGTLVALVLPAVQSARESARRIECQSHLKQLGVAMALHVDRDGAYPVGCIGCKLQLPPEGGPPAPQRFIAWNVAILPFLERDDLWHAFDQSVPSYRPANKQVGAHAIELFLCPSTPSDEFLQTKGLWQGAAFTDYAGIYGVEGTGHTAEAPGAAQWLRDEWLGVMVYETPVAPREVIDGLSKTASIAEIVLRRQGEAEWINGQNVFAQEVHTPINSASGIGNDIGSPHPGGASLLFCDGHVKFISEATRQNALNAMLTRAGND